MSILKYIDRLKRMDDLIRRKATGNAEEFSRKLGISVSVLKENIGEMRELGAEIEFCRESKSYFYKKKGHMLICFREDSLVIVDDTFRLKGGLDTMSLFMKNRY
jgi:biotin operon repressor